MELEKTHSQLFAGVEGGATCSKLVLMRGDGEVLTWSEAEGTNYLLNGMEETRSIVLGLLLKAKENAAIPLDTKITGLAGSFAHLLSKRTCLKRWTVDYGMSLSGAEDEYRNSEFIQGFKSYADLAEHYYIASDGVGTIVTALEKGGVVVIAGTGSSCRLLNTNGNVHGCGGHGHMIGDQGSAYWIALQAIKIVFETEDGLNRSPYDVGFVKERMMEFYNLKSKIGILDHLHKKFNKPNFAKFCRILAEGATEHKDLLCFHLFREAGRILGRHVLAVAKFADKSLLDQEGGFPIITVGSVWKSFELLKEGFLEGLQPRGRGDVKVEAIKLYRLKASPAIGAAFLAARESGVLLPVDFTTNAEVFFQTSL